MKHTKNILKSLLITVMALSLLTVSCKKDEGGGTPTNPTTTTITADDINQALTFTDLEVGTVAKISTTSPDVSKSTEIAVSATAIAQNISKADFKTAIEQIVSGLSISGATVTVDASAIDSATAKNPANCVLTIQPSGQNKFDTAIKGVKDNKLTITLKITPDKDWN